MSPSEPDFIDTIEPEDPNEALYELIEVRLHEYDLVTSRHLTPCLGQGHQREYGPEAGSFTGCPRCRKDTGDPFRGWRLQMEIDYLCNGGELASIPDYPTHEE